MKLLLDTHTFIWFIEGNSNLSNAGVRKLTHNLRKLTQRMLYKTETTLAVL
jgi:PIN domain nuclease of toxin-antitoxin system